jgi:hypothetical protein
MASPVTLTDCAYVRLAASFDFCRTSSSHSTAVHLEAATWAACSLSISVCSLSSPSPLKLLCRTDGSTVRSQIERTPAPTEAHFGLAKDPMMRLKLA